MLQIADKYDVPLLKEVCEETLGDCLTAANVVDLSILADKIDAQDLIKSVVKFVKRNFDSVFEKNDIRRIPKSIMYDIYSQNNGERSQKVSGPALKDSSASGQDEGDRVSKLDKSIKQISESIAKMKSARDL